MTDPTEAPTHETAPTGDVAGPPPTTETAAPEIAPSAEPPAPIVPAEELLAPDVPRLERPMGTARAIPETILGPRPSPTFLAVVSIVSLASDIITKLWAEKRLEGYPGYVNVIDNHLMFVLAKNKGGAWGLLQGQSENVRRPFFLLVSVAAIAFIVTLYRRLQPRQHALKWGLPLVLGGALGNVFDRIRYGFVIDFIDYRADWLHKFNELIQKKYPAHIVTDHWPTFNVADIAICVGVGLMAVDMLTSRRGKKPVHAPDVPIEPVGLVAEPLAAEAPPAPEAATDPADPATTTTTSTEG
ncbi:MAG TPA: signal peptidase II [Labilithrix sp.]|nr:signal peptidase II [Labilithrix sp.]